MLSRIKEILLRARVEATGAQSLDKTTKSAQNLNKSLDNTRHNSESVRRSMHGAAQMSSNTTKNFSKMAQTTENTLVPAYAKLAATGFAVSAVFRQFLQASQIAGLQDSLTAFANSSGIAMANLTDRIREATNAQIGFQQAARLASIGVASGIGGDRLTELARQATTIGQALGRDVEDVLQRMVRGITQSQPDLLKQIGILVNLDKALADYAEAHNLNARRLTQTQRAQALLNAVTEDYVNKFGDLEGMIPSNEFERLGKAFQDIAETGQRFAATFVAPVADLLAKDSILLISTALLIFSGVIRSAFVSLFPRVGMQMEESMKRSIALERERVAAVRAASAEIIQTRQKEMATIRAINQNFAAEFRRQLAAQGTIRRAGAGSLFSLMTGSGEITAAERRNAIRSIDSAISQIERGVRRRGPLRLVDSRALLVSWRRDLLAMENQSLATTTKMNNHFKLMALHMRNHMTSAISSIKVGLTRLVSSWGNLLGVAFTAAFAWSIWQNRRQIALSFLRAFNEINLGLNEFVRDAAESESKWQKITSNIINMALRLSRTQTFGIIDLTDVNKNIEEAQQNLREIAVQESLNRVRESVRGATQDFEDLRVEMENMVSLINTAGEVGVRQFQSLSNLIGNISIEDIDRRLAETLSLPEADQTRITSLARLDEDLGKILDTLRKAGFRVPAELDKLGELSKLDDPNERQALINQFGEYLTLQRQAGASLGEYIDQVSTFADERRRAFRNLDSSPFDQDLDALSSLRNELENTLRSDIVLQDLDKINSGLIEVFGSAATSVIGVAEAVDIYNSEIRRLESQKSKFLELARNSQALDALASSLGRLGNTAIADLEIIIAKQKNTMEQANIELFRQKDILRNQLSTDQALLNTQLAQVRAAEEKARQQQRALGVLEAQLNAARQLHDIEIARSTLARLTESFKSSELGQSLTALREEELTVASLRIQVREAAMAFAELGEQADSAARQRLTDLALELAGSEQKVRLLAVENRLSREKLENELKALGIAKELALVEGFDVSFGGERQARVLRIRQQQLVVQTQLSELTAQEARLSDALLSTDEEIRRAAEVQLERSRQLVEVEWAKLGVMQAQEKAALRLAQAIDSTLTSSFSDNLSNLIQGESGLKEAILGVGKSVLGGLADALADEITSMLFGDFSVADQIREAMIEGADYSADQIRAAFKGEESSAEPPLLKGQKGIFQTFTTKLSEILGTSGGGFLASFQSILGSIGSSLMGMFGGGSGGLLAGLLPFATGGIAPGGFQAFAKGSPVISKPTLGLVGEGRFNEAVVPLPDGKSIPVSIPGGGGAQQNNIEVQVNISGDQANTSVTSSGREGADLGKLIASAIQQQLISEKRPGGLLSRYGV